MKATLVLSNGVRISAPLSDEDAIGLLDDFISRLGERAKPHPKEPVYVKPPEPKPVTNTGYSPDTKLLAFICEECNRFGVIKTSKDTGVGDVISCRCGHEVQIKEIKTATGDCANCGTKFYSMSVVNGARELQCRNCKSPVDLAEKADGTLTGSHNLEH